MWQKTRGCAQNVSFKMGHAWKCDTPNNLFWAWWLLGRGIWSPNPFGTPQKFPLYGSPAPFASFLWQLLTRCPGAGIRLADPFSDLGETWVTSLSGLETYWGAEYVYWYWFAVIRDYDGYWSNQADLVSMWCHASRSSWNWWMSLDR